MRAGLPVDRSTSGTEAAKQIDGIAIPKPPTQFDSSGLVRGDGRAADVVAFEDAVVSFFIDAADMLGVPKSVAAIYGICFASPEPLSFSDINERLDISSGSISQGLRVLKEVGALKVADGAETLKRRNVTGRFKVYHFGRFKMYHPWGGVMEGV